MTKDWTDRLPESVRVACFDMQIVQMSPVRAAGQRAFGQFTANEQLIEIQTDMPSPAKLVDTLLHEILHAIYWAYGVEDEDKEERIVATLGTAWTQVWRDNPELLAWLSSIMNEIRK